LVATILAAEITDTSTVYVENETDGTYTLTLKNFILTLAGEPMYVGTIHIPGITGTANNGVVEIASTQNITIDSGDDESQYWMGPYLGEVPVELDGTIGDGTIALTLSITAAIGTIGVEFNGSVPAGIQAVPATAVKNDTPYTLTGVKAPAGYKGIVIENGRKVLK
ncbi:MAG: calycin-like domain-containing protein, partial [Prevotella sp.]|nr:calycin-like domain-containing protein [Prevotella sp.]